MYLESTSNYFLFSSFSAFQSFKCSDDSDPDVEDLFDLIIKLLVYEPKQRYTASQSLRHRFFDMYK